jgi:hypothetical protein
MVRLQEPPASCRTAVTLLRTREERQSTNFGRTYALADSTGCYDAVVDLPIDRIDWTGVEPEASPLEPLDARTFAIRLQRLSERAGSLTRLRKAFADQHPRGEQLPRDSESAPRPSR